MLEQLRAALAAILAEMQTLNSAVVGENNAVRAFTPEEQARYADLEAKSASTEDAIKRCLAQAERQRQVDALRQNDGTAPHVTVTRAENHDEHGNYRGFRSFGEQMQAVARASAPGQSADRRLEEVRAASGMNEANDSEGGFLIQSDFMAEMIRDTYDSAVIAPLCRRVPLSTSATALEIITVDETSRVDGSRFGGVQSYWVAEAGTVTPSFPKHKKIRIQTEELMALAYVTGNLLSDAPALASVLSRGFVEEFAFQVDSSILLGNGVGKPYGILNSPALIEVAKETNQTADTVVFANVSNMKKRMTRKGKSRGLWLYNNDVSSELEKLYVPLGSSNGLPVYSPAGAWGVSEERLYNRPLVEHEACSPIGDVGDLIFIDPQEYMLVEKSTISADMSIHVRFLYNENCFRWLLRIGGQPLWTTPVTPYKGSLTRSPFVALAAR